MTADEMKLGMVVCLSRELEIFPLGVFPARASGTIVDLNEEYASVRLDMAFPCLAEWDNCLHVWLAKDAYQECLPFMWEEVEGEPAP